MKRIFLFLFLALMSSVAWAAYDGTKPTGQTPIASYPPIIKENLRALKDDALVNAGRVASLTVDDLYGFPMSCYASTTSTEIVASAGQKFTLDTATGTVQFWIYGQAVATDSQNNLSLGVYLQQTARIGTSVVLLNGPLTVYWGDTSQLANWRLNVTAASNGQITCVASSTIGTNWQIYCFKRCVRRVGQ